MVRLKDISDIIVAFEQCKFQFLMVRLKDNLRFTANNNV